jgi:Fic family protein
MGQIENMKYQPPYTITSKIIYLIAQISENIGRLTVLEEIQDSLKLRKANRIRTIQGSLAIEGNTLSTEQITAILNGKTVIAPPKEVQEVRNAIKAYEAFQQWQPSQESDLLQAHQILMTGLIDEVGQYRHGGVGVMSGDRVVHMAPPANQINRFADGNGRMGRLWQTLILSRWNPIFANIPVESLIYQNQKAYYEALQASTDRTDSAPFIEFILQMILDAILSSNDTAQASDHATAQASDHVQRLISAMKLEDYTLAELMQLVGLNHRATFQKNYLNPAIEADLIERTIPDKPKSPKQRYRLKS